MSNVAVEHNEAALEHAVSGPQRLIKFFHDTRDEMRKVITPTRAEVQSGTIVVIATVFIFAAYFEIIDVVIGKGIDKLFLHLTKH